MRPRPFRSSQVASAKSVAKVRMSAAAESAAEKRGCHWLGARPTSQCFNVTKIWSIVSTSLAESLPRETTNCQFSISLATPADPVRLPPPCLWTPWRFKHNTRTFQGPFRLLSRTFQTPLNLVASPSPSHFQPFSSCFHNPFTPISNIFEPRSKTISQTFQSLFTHPCWRFPAPAPRPSTLPPPGQTSTAPPPSVRHNRRAVPKCRRLIYILQRICQAGI